MRRVLFVDDEQYVLAGLRDGLRRQRNVWDMHFETSGDDALQRMSEAPFDVLITDMRMPVMDGAALLRRVKEEFPATIRIVLSGQADRDLVVRMLPVAQQFLAKPCPIDRVRVVIERALALRELLDDTSILALIGSVATLPSVPTTYWALTEALSSGSAGVTDIAHIVERDSALSAKVLQLVNSSFFGLSHSVMSVTAALNYMGIELLRALALSVGIFAAAHADGITAEYLVDAEQRESLLVANLARRIVSDRSRRDEAFTTGMLHDIGQLVLASRLGDRYGAVLRDVRHGTGSLREAELRLLGATHSHVGAVLLGSWGLPCGIVQAVAFHESIHEGGYADDAVMIAVHAAVALVSAELHGRASLVPLDEATLAEHGFASMIPEWRAETRAVISEFA